MKVETELEGLDKLRTRIQASTYLADVKLQRRIYGELFRMEEPVMRVCNQLWIPWLLRMRSDD